MDHRKSKRIPEKTSTSASLCESQQTIKKLLKRWDYRPPYLPKKSLSGQEATVRARHGTMNWFKIGKGLHQGCIFSPWLFNLQAEYITWNAELDQAGIKIAGRNINNLRYAHDTTLMAESKEELKSLFQHHSSKASILQHSAFFVVLLSHPYITTRKTIALTNMFV